MGATRTQKSTGGKYELVERALTVAVGIQLTGTDWFMDSSRNYGCSASNRKLQKDVFTVKYLNPLWYSIQIFDSESLH